MAHEEKESGAFLHVMRGCYVRVEDTRLLDTPWRTWITVARARLLAVHALGSGDRVFVGASSLASRGIPLWEANPDVYVWAPTRRGSKLLRAVRAAGVLVPGVSVRWSVVSPLERELQTVGGVLAEGVIDAAVRMACWSESLSAFVGICMVLNRQSSFDLFSQEECRDRAQGVRSEMLVRLTEWRQHNDNIPAREQQPSSEPLIRGVIILPRRLAMGCEVRLCVRSCDAIRDSRQWAPVLCRHRDSWSHDHFRVRWDRQAWQE